MRVGLFSSSFEERKDVIYSIPCKTCGIRYIGETGQYFCDRRSQHQREVRNRKKTNGFYAHLNKNNGHEVDWENVSFLDSEKFWKGRRVKESLYISAQNPSKVVDAKVILNLEKGLELDPMWDFLTNNSEGKWKRKFLEVLNCDWHFLLLFPVFGFSRVQLELAFAYARGSCSGSSMMKPG